MEQWSILILVSGYVVFTLHAQIRIMYANVLSANQKLINSLLIWLIPFFWFFVVRVFLKKDFKTITKKDRDQMQRRQDSGSSNQNGGAVAG